MISKTLLAAFAIVVVVSLITASGVSGTALAKKSSSSKACEKRAASKDHHLAGYEKRECAHNPNAFKHGH
jgi:hypothetical protein